MIVAFYFANYVQLNTLHLCEKFEQIFDFLNIELYFEGGMIVYF